MDRPNEELFDAMIRIAGREAIQRESKAFPKEEEIDLTPSPAFERKMRRLIKKAKTHGTDKKYRAFLRIAAACIAVLSITFTSAFAFVPPFRESVTKAVVKWTSVDASFTFPGGKAAEGDDIRPSYIPKGFVETDFWEDGAEIEITYTNDASVEIYYWRMTTDGSKLSVDLEHSDYSEGKINGLAAHIFTSNTEGYPSYVVFNDDEYAYMISGYVPARELILIAENVPVQKPGE